MSRKIKNSLGIFIFLSVLVHLFTLGVIEWTANPTKIQNTAQTLEIQILETEDRKRKQIVEQDERPVNDEIPDKTDFLGRHNQSVVKETKAKNHGDFVNSSGQAGINPTKKSEAPRPSRKKVAKTDGTLPSLEKLNPKFDFSQSRREVLQNESEAGQASSSNDHLKDVNEGIETILNSKEFVYYTYYQRIRSQIRQHWEPSIREKVRRIFAQGRSIASTRDHVTRVVIILNKQGELVRVQVIGASGVQDLDEAAVEAFRAAQPFPNPPKGIIDSDGTIKINWDFVLEA